MAVEDSRFDLGLGVVPLWFLGRNRCARYSKLNNPFLFSRVRVELEGVGYSLLCSVAWGTIQINGLRGKPSRGEGLSRHLWRAVATCL